MCPRFCEPTVCGCGDAGWRGHHEKGGSLSEGHPTFLCGDADHLHPLLHPSVLDGLFNTEGFRGQSFPEQPVLVSLCVLY